MTYQWYTFVQIADLNINMILPWNTTQKLYTMMDFHQWQICHKCDKMIMTNKKENDSEKN